MKPYSNDLRRRIIERIQKNEESQPEIAELFNVSLSFVEKLWHRFRATGSYEALPHGGGRERLLSCDEQLIRSEVRQQPDITLGELVERVAFQTGKAKVSLETMSDELQGLDLPRKKKMIYASERETEQAQAKREDYEREIAVEIVSRLKFIDEAGSNLAMTRLYGRAARGERVIDSVPKNYGENVSMLACLSMSGIVAPMTIDGAVDGLVFKAYVEQVLCPTLCEGD